MSLRSLVSSFALLIVTSLPLLASAAPTEWKIDTAHSSATFSIRHMMVSNVRGEFGNLTGTLMVDDADLTKSSVTAEIDAATINTRVAKRDEHLKSPDFFDVSKFPKLTFKSTKVEKAGNQLKVTGDLSIHGVTKSIVLTAELPTPAIKDPFGNTKRGFSATAKINRKDFGLHWNKALEVGGGVVVGEEVSINIDIEANQAAPSSPAPVPVNANETLRVRVY